MTPRPRAFALPDGADDASLYAAAVLYAYNEAVASRPLTAVETLWLSKTIAAFSETPLYAYFLTHAAGLANVGGLAWLIRRRDRDPVRVRERLSAVSKLLAYVLARLPAVRTALAGRARQMRAWVTSYRRYASEPEPQNLRGMVGTIIPMRAAVPGTGVARLIPLLVAATRPAPSLHSDARPR